MKTYIYIVNDWKKTRCPIDCDESGPYKPCCPHQRWFPIPHRVTLTLDNSKNIIRKTCTEGSKANGVRCSEMDIETNSCSHTNLVEEFLNGTIDGFQRGRITLSNIININKGPKRCPNCGETWCVKPADNKSITRWKRAHKKFLKKGGEVPELYMCRHPNCQDNKGPWVFFLGIEDRPSGNRRHETPINERIW